LIQKNSKNIRKTTTLEKIKREQIQSSTPTDKTKKPTKVSEKNETSTIKVEKKEAKK